MGCNCCCNSFPDFRLARNQEALIKMLFEERKTISENPQYYNNIKMAENVLNSDFCNFIDSIINFLILNKDINTQIFDKLTENLSETFFYFYTKNESNFSFYFYKTIKDMPYQELIDIQKIN